MGLRLGEGLCLEVGDIDAANRRVHVRQGKGGKDRYVPLPGATLAVLRRFCPVSIRLTGGVNLVDRSGLLF
jgi:integrase